MLSRWIARLKEKVLDIFTTHRSLQLASLKPRIELFVEVMRDEVGALYIVFVFPKFIPIHELVVLHHVARSCECTQRRLDSRRVLEPYVLAPGSVAYLSE